MTVLAYRPSGWGFDVIVVLYVLSRFLIQTLGSLVGWGNRDRGTDLFMSSVVTPHQMMDTGTAGYPEGEDSQPCGGLQSQRDAQIAKRDQVAHRLS
ncbi:hypothetical protein NDU88_005270 [Pleurodeles waltl]|uniref:Uncharacterized protein n=1 Tax=Pleurodeles waltl TaxID=8319 RepID=A0AAV7VM66_PLEWA|nr:hypothetical protein NDU88_005270 [Pleurodeles waltl]